MERRAEAEGPRALRVSELGRLKAQDDYDDNCGSRARWYLADRRGRPANVFTPERLTDEHRLIARRPSTSWTAKSARPRSARAERLDAGPQARSPLRRPRAARHRRPRGARRRGARQGLGGHGRRSGGHGPLRLPRPSALRQVSPSHRFSASASEQQKQRLHAAARQRRDRRCVCPQRVRLGIGCARRSRPRDAAEPTAATC